MKDGILSVLKFLLGIILLSAYVNGLFHSYEKHGRTDCIIGVVVIPWGVYRGFEMLWHNDTKKLDWDVILEADLKTSVDFLAEANNIDVSNNKYNSDLNTFSSKINSY